MSIWFGRGPELATLERLAESGRAELLLLYGRRRVGKSELLERFLGPRRGLRLLAREESEAVQLRGFSGTLAERFGDRLLETNPFTSWDAFFSHLADKGRERTIVALDEFPYLVSANAALPSLLQAHWDETLRHTNIFLILCGSSIGMMESFMGSRSPLYGRRTAQMLLKPLSLAEALPHLGPARRAVEAYAVFGGTPAYLLEYDRRGDLMSNIREKILSPERSMYRDVEFVLRQEVREPRAYFSILESIAKGNTRLGPIINDAGLEKGVLAKYLGVLMDLQLVRREVPVTEASPWKSRKGIYQISDFYFRFWFRFVYPFIQAVEEGRRDWLLESVIRPRLDAFVGPVFEQAAREALPAMDLKGELPFRLMKLGRWWDRNAEIDLVGVGERDNLFCEVKWSDGVDAAGVVEGLREKAAGTGLPGTPHFCVVARSFKRKSPGVLHIDLKALERHLAA
jgi:AAA+ ATPase superfamily predicted ATPase